MYPEVTWKQIAITYIITSYNIVAHFNWEGVSVARIFRILCDFTDSDIHVDGRILIETGSWEVAVGGDEKAGEVCGSQLGRFFCHPEFVELPIVVIGGTQPAF